VETQQIFCIVAGFATAVLAYVVERLTWGLMKGAARLFSVLTPCVVGLVAAGGAYAAHLDSPMQLTLVVAAGVVVGGAATMGYLQLLDLTANAGRLEALEQQVGDLEGSLRRLRKRIKQGESGEHDLSASDSGIDETTREELRERAKQLRRGR